MDDIIYAKLKTEWVNNDKYTNSSNQGVLQGIVKRNLQKNNLVLNHRNNPDMGFLFGSTNNEAVRNMRIWMAYFKKMIAAISITTV